MFSLATRPQTAGEIYWQGVCVWTRLLRYLAPIAVIFAIFSLLPHYFVPELEANLAMPDVFQLHPLFFIMYFIVGLTIFTLIMKRIYMDLNDMPGGFFVAFWEVVKKLPAIIAVELIVRILVMIGLILLFFPGIYVYILLLMALPLVVLQNENVIHALKRSYEITRYSWWHTAITAFVPIIIYWFLDYSIYLVPTDHASIQSIAGDNGWIIKAALRFLLTTLFLPYLASIMVILLRDLELRYAAMMESDISS